MKTFTILCFTLASCQAPPALHPGVIHLSPQAAYVYDVLLLREGQPLPEPLP